MSRHGSVGVVFVHGLFSSSKTWAGLLSLISSDEGLSSVEPQLFEYATPKMRWRPDRRIPNYNDLAEHLKTYLLLRAKDYDALVLVAHSQGGLIVQRYLSRMLGSGRGEDLAKIKGVILFACPNDGSGFGLLGRRLWWQRHPQEEELRPYADQVKDAQRVVINQIVHATAVGPSTCPIPFWVYGGTEDNVVQRASAQGAFPSVSMLPGNHSSIVRPLTRNAEAYGVLRHHLTEIQRPGAELAPARLSTNQTAAAENWTSSLEKPQLRLRAVATINWDGESPLEITAQRRRKLVASLPDSPISEVLTRLSETRGGAELTGIWSLGSQGNSLDRADYVCTLRTAEGTPALAAEVMVGVRGGSVVTCCELRVESAPAWWAALTKANSAPQDTGLSLQEVHDVLAAAWTVATKLLPGAVSDIPSALPMACPVTVELRMSAESRHDAPQPHLLLEDVVDLAPLGETDRQFLQLMAATVTLPTARMATQPDQDLIAGALSWMYQKFGFIEAPAASLLTTASTVTSSHQPLPKAHGSGDRRSAGVRTLSAIRTNDSLRLSLPHLDSPESLLTFANTSIARVGREEELQELSDFLSTDKDFSWWLWTGSAGSGKSRLSIELCRAVSGTWHAGFLREDDQATLSNIQPKKPTLIVVDYAAQRGTWLSDALFQLSRRSLAAPVRVLILERQASGLWWETAQRAHRFEESVQIQASRHGLPRELGGLSDKDIRTLVKSVAVQSGVELSSTNLEDIANHAQLIDAEHRPLFALVAALDWLDGDGASTGRDEALRRLLARLDGQTRAAAGVLASAPRDARNVRTLATVLGGVSIEVYDRIMQLPPPLGLLPGLHDDFHSLSLERLLDGVRPDMLGELYVLDRLAASGTERAATTALLRVAWHTDPAAYAAFVERTVGDHREHDHLVALLDVEDWPQSPIIFARVIIDTIPLLRRSDHPALEWIFSRLEAQRESAPNAELDELIITARFRFANLVIREDDYPRANALLTEALAACDPLWPVRANILNNRGITWLSLDNSDAAEADFTTVIEDPSATDEARACAFNNRADIHEDGDDRGSAIADRSAVLALAETTYNRRYIALVRRARALWHSGNRVAAYHDIEAILVTPDIAQEQKMAALLQRAQWRIDSGEPTKARTDLEAVTASVRNFDDVERKASDLLSAQ
ncbi:alpha/beta fold hydrolase [Streptomyces sp. NPDC058405]|uniref:alpha/beta fold hydrolase n=1 Tax=Streptomyces sp. NPDC058405 TaxID=3346482 RepID=UPI0036545CF7